MKAQQEKLIDLLGSEGIQFYIPVFQRSYTWSQAQCDELWRDMLKSANEECDHFTGAVLCMPESDGLSYQIVDGQQRLATLTLLMIALRDFLGERDASIMGLDASRVEATYFGTPDKPRLTMNAADNPTLLSLEFPSHAQPAPAHAQPAGGTQSQSTQPAPSHAQPAPTYTQPTGGAQAQSQPQVQVQSAQPIEGTQSQSQSQSQPQSQKLKDNVRFFREKLDDPELDLLSLWKGIRSLNCIFVELDTGDNAQVVFESLNSKGVQLTTADLCRNYLLAGLPQAEQMRLYEDFWEPIEDLFGDDPGSLRLNNAILGWLTVRFRRIRAKGDKEAYHVFRRYMQEEFSGTIEALMGELYNFCTVWAENYRYHPIKQYKSATNWSTLGPKTLVSHIPIKPASPEALEFYAKHFGIVTKR